MRLRVAMNTLVSMSDTHIRRLDAGSGLSVWMQAVALAPKPAAVMIGYADWFDWSFRMEVQI